MLFHYIILIVSISHNGDNKEVKNEKRVIIRNEERGINHGLTRIILLRRSASGESGLSVVKN